MGGQYTRRPPDLVVVGSASRDLTPDDPRGWRLGGAVSYGALAAARLGLRTAALIGVDPLAARAAELDLLRQAGVEVVLAELDHGPVFVNREEPGGRVQGLVDAAEPVSPDRLPDAWRDAAVWLLSPVADELPASWADMPPSDALVAVAWQGILRTLVPGRDVTRRPAAASSLLARADVVGVSVDDLEPGTGIDTLVELVKPGATILLTHGASGGLAVTVAEGGERSARRWPAVTAAPTIDPTGAGDVFLAAFLSATAQPDLAGRGTVGARLRIAATAASFAVERPGLLGVPDLAMVRNRASRRRADSRPGSSAQDTA